MNKVTTSILLYIFIDSLLLIVSLTHIPSLLNRSTLPFSVKENDGMFIVENVAHGTNPNSITVGDTIAAVNDSLITIAGQLEFIADNSAIGRRVTITTIKNGRAFTSFIETVPFYPNLLYIIIIFFVGITFLSVGFFVVWSRPRDTIAHLFHWMMVLVGTVIMITWGSIESNELSTIVVRTLFFISYVFGIASFYLFTKLYCAVTPRFINVRIAAIYTVASLFCGVLIYYHMSAIDTQSLSIYAVFQRYFDLFHIALFITFIAGIVNIISAYRTSDSSDERNRLEWILWGFSISCTPFLLLHILPQVLFSRYLIAEEYATIFFIVLPFSFGVSFIKHHLFDIRLLIKRTIVNFIFSALIAITYFIIVILVTAVVNQAILTTENFIIVVLTLIIAMLFNPLRNRVRTFIDRLLFKAHSEYSNIVSDVTQRLQNSVSSEEIFAIVLDSIYSSLPAERCFMYRHEHGRLVPIDQSGSQLNNTKSILIEDIQTIISSRCTAVNSIIRTEKNQLIRIDNDLPLKTGCEILVPIKSVRIPLHGAVGISRLQTTEKFDSDEISLLITICDQAAEHLDRLTLLESVFREKEERKRAEELNSLKSDFVSYVSHELQTPLTSIRMFSELLQKKFRTKQGKEHLQIIAGESDRLSRMVNNLLDVSRIESGLNEYRFEPCSLDSVVGAVIKKMKYMIDKHGFRVRYTPPRTPIMIDADKDAIEQTVLNLISNAIKYSLKQKYIRITVSRNKRYAICAIQDKGNGIPKKNIPFLFSRFYRLPEHHNTVKGVGLGLSLVKHIIDAHGGKIEVYSTVGKGSTFTMFIPLHKSKSSV